MSYVEQVGGSHYSETEYQHWDMVIDTDMHYLLGCATKYLYRTKANRYEDLEKAKSFITKASACGARGIHQDDCHLLYIWLNEAELPQVVVSAIEHAAHGEYDLCLAVVEDLIEMEAMLEMKAYVNQG